MQELVNHLIDLYQKDPLPALSGNARAIAAQDISRMSPLLLLTGMRGCGKTSRLIALSHYLQESGIAKGQVLYFDFADQRLARYEGKRVLTCVIDSYFGRHPKVRSSRSYLLLDNIAHIEGWQVFFHRILDAYDVRIAAADACRSWLALPDDSPLHGSATAVEVLGTLRPTPSKGSGSLFEIQRQNDLGQALIGDVLRKDPHLPAGTSMRFAAYALGLSGQRLSITKAQQSLKEERIATTRLTLSNLLERLEDAHLLSTVGEYSQALKKNPRAAKTVYAGSLDFAQAFAPQGKPDSLSLLKTAAYLELRQENQARNICSYKTASGDFVDFACIDPETRRVRALYAIAAEDESGKIPPKALASLGKAIKETGTSQAAVITMQTYATVEMNGKKIPVLPLAAKD